MLIVELAMFGGICCLRKMVASTAFATRRGWSVCPGIPWSVCPGIGGQLASESGGLVHQNLQQSVPPMEFEHLRVMITDNKVQNAIDELLERKKNADEKALIAPVPILNQWLSDMLDLCKERTPALPSEKKRPDELNNIFRKYIQP